MLRVTSFLSFHEILRSDQKVGKSQAFRYLSHEGQGHKKADTAGL